MWQGCWSKRRDLCSWSWWMSFNWQRSWIFYTINVGLYILPVVNIYFKSLQAFSIHNWWQLQPFLRLMQHFGCDIILILFSSLIFLVHFFSKSFDINNKFQLVLYLWMKKFILKLIKSPSGSSHNQMKTISNLSID